MGNEQLILQAIDRIWPDWISNTQLKSRTGVEPHQQVFQLTRKLMNTGRIEGEQRGKEWFFRAVRSNPKSAVPSQVIHETPRSTNRSSQPPEANVPPNYSSFEFRARNTMSAYFGVQLPAGSVPNVPKKFDMLSGDGSVVGDAKFFDLVRGESLPPAKFSIIAEHVWLLEKADARVRFLVFGNNRDVPAQWLKRYAHLVKSVGFLFLDKDGVLQVLLDPNGAFPF